MIDIYSSLVEWSKKLPGWERDALRRVVSFGAPDAESVGELVAMAKAESGIAGVVPKPLPLAAEHVSGSRTPSEVVVLDSMHGVKNANALATGQRLAFARAGLTVIYGENGSGKSGYARVLRRACRARRASDILNHVGSVSPGVPEASFTVTKGNAAPHDVRWVQGEPPPDELAAFCVFDRECERSFIDDEGETAFVPDGLDAFQELASVVAQVKQNLIDEERRTLPSDGALDDIRREVLAPPEAVALLGGIVAGKTADAYERMLATVSTFCASTDEIKKFEQLELKLAELKINDPLKRGADLRRFAQSVEGCTRTWRSLGGALADEGIVRLRGLIDREREAKKALVSVASGALADVPGLGSDPWRAMYQAAAAYATEHVHPGVDFPNTGDGASCPLCLQLMDSNAKARFERFHAYMTRAAERTAEQASKARASASKAMLDALPTEVDEHSLQVLHERDPAVAAAARGVPAAISARQQAIVAAIASSNWASIPTIDGKQLDTVEGAVAALRADAVSAEKLADPQARAALQTERNALAGRIEIGKRQARIKETIAKFREAARLLACHGKISTNTITAKGSELATELLTDGLIKGFEAEMTALGAADRISVKVGHRGDKGRSLYSLTLAGARGGGWNRSQVLSEGEQRVVAFAYFLAETRLAPSPVGIIVDDPVSSLDHRWCGPIAERLSLLAGDRQVIIFTHSISFYVQLERCATEGQVPFHAQFLVRRAGVPGHCDALASPSEKLGVAVRVTALNEEVKQLRSLHGDDADGRGYRDAANGFVDRMRGAWERAVEEVVLNRVVERFDDVVKTQSLRGVVCDDETFKAVNDAMSRLSANTQAHDKGAGHVGSVRSPDEFARDLKALEVFVSDHKKKRKDVDTRREELRTPPAAQVAARDEVATPAPPQAPPSAKRVH